MNVSQVKKLVGKQKFTAVFKKVSNNKELRVMSGTLNMTKHVNGRGQPITDGRVVMYDVQAKGVRSFYPERLVSIKVNGHTYDGNGDELKTA